MSREPALPLIGRSDELEEIKLQIQKAAAGYGSIVLVEGAAGMGKTRLLEEALSFSSSLGRVLHSTADQLDAWRPFSPVAECLGIRRGVVDEQRRSIFEQLTGKISPDAGVGAAAGSPSAEFRVAEDMIALIEQLCAQEPVFLAIDDLHWCDPASLHLIHRLVRRIGELPLLVIGALRQRPRSEELYQLIQECIQAGATHLLLGPFGENDVVRLAEAVLGAPPDPSLVRQLMKAGGNPQLVMDLVTALQDEESIRLTEGGEASVTSTEVPSSVIAKEQRRLRHFPPQQLEVLQLASVLGSSFSLGELASFSGKPAPTLIAPLRDSVAEGLLIETADGLAFSSDLVRHALYADLPEAFRADLHARAAGVLASAGAPPDRVADHLMLGGSSGDVQAVEWLRRAAREAAPRAPAQAAQFLEKALELVSGPHPPPDSLLAELAMCLAWAGRFRDGESICREALSRGCDPSVEPKFRMYLVQSLLGGGSTEEARSVAEAAIKSSATTDADRERFRAWVSTCALVVGDFESAAVLAEEAWMRAEELEDALTASVALGVLGAVAYYQGRFGEAVQMAEEAIRFADLSPDLEGHRFPTYFFLGRFLHAMDRLEDGQAALRRGRRVAEGIGAGGQLPAYQWALASGEFLMGEWDNALAECQASRELAEQIGAGQGILFSHSLRAVINLHRDDLEATEEALGAAQQELAKTGPQFGVVWMMWGRALLLEAHGQLDASYSILSNAWDLCDSMGMKSELHALGPDMVRMSLGRGDRERAEDACREMHALARKSRVASVEGADLRCSGLLDASPETMLRAVDAYRRGPRPFDLALALEDAGILAAEAGNTMNAQSLVDEAIEIYRRLSAWRDAERTGKRAETWGIRCSPGETSRPETTGWSSLTQAEKTVAALVVDGMTNARISEQMMISQEAVNAHVAAILGKLDMTSRTALAYEGIRRGP